MKATTPKTSKRSKLDKAVCKRFNEIQLPPELFTDKVRTNFNKGHVLCYNSRTQTCTTLKKV